jgi:hypothetical protein
MNREQKLEALAEAREALQRSRRELARDTAERATIVDDYREPIMELRDQPLEYRTTMLDWADGGRNSQNMKIDHSPIARAAPVDYGSNYWDQLEQWLAVRLKRERKLTNQSVGAAIDELLADAEKKARSELQQEVELLLGQIAELRALINAQGARVLDLPARRVV